MTLKTDNDHHFVRSLLGAFSDNDVHIFLRPDPSNFLDFVTPWFKTTRLEKENYLENIYTLRELFLFGISPTRRENAISAYTATLRGTFWIKRF